MMDVTLNDAYREACTALGEQIVTQRLMAQHAAELEAELARLIAEQAEEPPSETTETVAEDP